MVIAHSNIAIYMSMILAFEHGEMNIYRLDADYLRYLLDYNDFP